MNDEDSQVRRDAVSAISPYAQSNAVTELLVKAASDEAVRVRALAVQGLQKSAGSPHVAAALLQALRDRDAAVREAALSALGARATGDMSGMGMGGGMMGGMGGDMGDMGGGMGGMGGSGINANITKAVSALNKIADDPARAIRDLVEYLKSENAPLARSAQSLLIKYGIEAEPALKELLSQPKGTDSPAWQRARSALDSIRSEARASSGRG